MDGPSRLIVLKSAENLERIKREHPLVHNITNYVVMNFTANVLLAFGASPVMAHAVEEMDEMVGLANALVINIGTLSPHWVDGMFRAARAAGTRSVPIVLDPVGAGATRFRTDTARRLLDETAISVVRGNASEILAVAGKGSLTRGVDSADGAEDAREAASELAAKSNVVVAVTGAEDFVTDGSRSATIANGHPMMGRITGTGCAASALAGAFCAVDKDMFRAAAGALVAFGIAGETAAGANPGPGSFQVRLLDALDAIGADMIREKALVTVS